MLLKPEKSGFNSLPAQLLAVVFSVYMILAITITLLHMILEYQESHKQIEQQLQTISNSMGPGLARALWDLNMEQVQSEYLGLMSLPEIVGIKIQDENQSTVGLLGVVEKENGLLIEVTQDKREISVAQTLELFSYSHQLFVNYAGRSRMVGSITLYSSFEVVFNRVKYNFLYIVASALIKSLGLWLIFLFFADKMLGRPLKQFIHGIESIDVGHSIKPELKIYAYGENELSELEKAFNELIRRLNQSELDKQKVNEELERSEAMFKNLVRMLPVGIFHTDPDGNCIFANPKWSELTGLPRDESLGSGWIKAVHIQDRKKVQEFWNQSLNLHKDFKQEFRLSQKDGSIKWVIGQASAEIMELTDEMASSLKRSHQNLKIQSTDNITRVITGYFCTITDITALKQAQEEISTLNLSLESRVEKRTSELAVSNRELSKALDSLREAQDQLIETEKMAALGELVAGIAHEINTPLGVALTAVTHLNEALEQLHSDYIEGRLTKKEFEIFYTMSSETSDMVHKNIRRASELIASFKLVAVDQHSDEMRLFNVKDYLNEIMISLTPNLKRTEHKVTVACDDGIEMYSYPGSIYQIISNLVMNTIIHGFEFKKEGEISIRVDKEPEHVKIHYQDNGKGMSEEEVRRIFNPFYTTRRGRGGSGLGAYIVYNLVTQRLGGQIECHSQPGQGVLFQIDLPDNLRSQKNEKNNSSLV